MEQRLSERLQCPICFEIPEREVYQCNNGHQICHDCCRTLAHCPQCRVKYENPKIRNRAVEAILDDMTFECPYKDKGCSKQLKREVQMAHRRECKFVPFALCKMVGLTTCDFVAHRIPLLTTKHLQTAHKIKVCEGSHIQICHLNFGSLYNKMVNSRMNTSKLWNPILWKSDKDEYSPPFLIIAMIRKEFNDWKFSWICLHMGDSKEEAEKFQARFTIGGIFGQDKNGPVLKWKCNPSHYRSLPELLQKPPMPVPLKFLKDFAIKRDGGGRLVLNLKMKSLQTRNMESDINAQKIQIDLNF